MKALAILGLLLLGCGGGSDGTTTDPANPGTGGSAVKAEEACTPGLSVACTGPAGCKGGQVCEESGAGYGVCECSVPADAGALGPGDPDPFPGCTVAKGYTGAIACGAPEIYSCPSGAIPVRCNQPNEPGLSAMNLYCCH